LFRFLLFLFLTNILLKWHFLSPHLSLEYTYLAIKQEGDTVLRINGQSLESVTLEEASRLLQRSREKLSLVVQRDVRRGNGGNGGVGPGGGSSRWPSQTTVYERLGSLQANFTIGILGA
jgi:hypothetical protein